MYCSLCVYFTEQEECRLQGKVIPEQQKAGCDAFIEHSFRIVGSSGCCGISGLPFLDPPERGEVKK